MAAQLTNLVPIFDRQNYGQWSKAMKAFLMSQGLWGFTDGSVSHPGPGTPLEEVSGWQRLADMARGNIVLCLAPAIQQGVEDTATTQAVWHHLEVGYGSPSATTIYKDLKEAISVTNQGIGPRRTDTEPPCYKGNERRTRPFGFPTGLGPDRPREIHAVTL